MNIFEKQNTCLNIENILDTSLSGTDFCGLVFEYLSELINGLALKCNILQMNKWFYTTYIKLKLSVMLLKIPEFYSAVFIKY